MPISYFGVDLYHFIPKKPNMGILVRYRGILERNFIHSYNEMATSYNFGGALWTIMNLELNWEI